MGVMKRFWLIFDIVGLVLLLGLAGVTTHAFYAAYISGSKQIIVDINSIGEANLEAILVGLVVVWGMVSIGRIIWGLI